MIISNLSSSLIPKKLHQLDRIRYTHVDLTHIPLLVLYRLLLTFTQKVSIRPIMSSLVSLVLSLAKYFRDLSFTDEISGAIVQAQMYSLPDCSRHYSELRIRTVVTLSLFSSWFISPVLYRNL